MSLMPFYLIFLSSLFNSFLIKSLLIFIHILDHNNYLLNWTSRPKITSEGEMTKMPSVWLNGSKLSVPIEKFF